MKKHVLLAATILIAISLFSQNWNPFPEDQISYYKYKLGDETYVDKVSVKKEIINNEDYYFIKSREDKLNPCLWDFFGSEQWEWNEWGYYGASVDYYKFENNNYNFYGNSIGYKPAHSIQEYLDDGGIEFTVYPYLKLNEGNCTKVGIEEFLGIQDSVKTYVYSNRQGQYSLKLSKNYGLIKFSNFWGYYHAPQNYRDSSIEFEIIGFNTSEQKIAYQQPEFKDYFHLSEGDVLYWKCYLFDGEGYNTFSNPYTQIQEIVNSSISENAVTYDYISKKYNEQGKLEATNNYSKTYENSKEGAILKSQPNWFRILDYVDWEQQIVKLEFQRLEFDGNDTITISEVFCSGMTLYNNDGSCYAANYTADYWRSEIFSTNYGYIGFYGRYVVGSIIDGVASGDTTIITKVANKLVNTNTKIFPNPAKDKLNITSITNNIEKVEIHNELGQVILRAKYSNSVDLEGIVPGIYTVKIIDKNETFETQKLIIE